MGLYVYLPLEREVTVKKIKNYFFACGQRLSKAA